jgi:large subunit ribosomal protein L25
MANFTSITAELRERAGKGAARATRRAGKVPAVIYGAKQTPTLISLEPRAVIKELHRGGWRSRLYEVDLGRDKARALIRDVQFHPVTDQPEHVDFQRLAPGEQIRVAVAVVFEGEAVSPGLKRGGVLNVVRHTVEVYADPETVPEHFSADLSTLDINDNIRFSDLKGTEGTRPTIVERDFVVATVASVTQNAADVAEEAAIAAAQAAAAPAKGGKAGGKAAPAKPAAAAAPAKKK